MNKIKYILLIIAISVLASCSNTKSLDGRITHTFKHDLEFGNPVCYIFQYDFDELVVIYSENDILYVNEFYSIEIGNKWDKTMMLQFHDTDKLYIVDVYELLNYKLKQ